MSKVPDKARPTITTRLGVSLPTAIGALLFAGAIAFGSGMVGAPSAGQGSQEGVAQGGDYRGHGGLNPGQGQDKPKPPAYDHPDKQQPDPVTPKPEPQPEQPKPETEQQQQPKPEQQPDKPKPPAPSGPMQLQAQSGLGKVKLTWSKFAGEGFGYYKIVRSTDAAVAWPLGSGDTLVGWTHDPYQNWFKDFPPCGTAFSYRVFAVTGDASGYQVLSASNVVTGTAQCEAPPPDPTPMAFTVSVVDGGVALVWEKCTADGFMAYKVVRSQTNADPMYPLNGGTELIAAIGDPNVTSLVDTNVASGQTWTYRVLSMANNGSGWYPIGLTPAVSVTVP
ncbi:MAG TPA: hypothetical protein VFP83_04440 [Candidatus Limnocylindria bacterium]|nr:hypothetical protein [Candidatus Limnocylindria bacterium]